MVAAQFAGSPRMARDQVDMTPIETRDELVAWFAAGIKPKSQFRLGTEHEKFAFTVEGRRPVPYEGRRSIRALLEGMQHLLGWEPIIEDGNIIGLFDVTGGGAISLEPGGQFELSGAPVETVHQTSAELMAHRAQVKEVARPLGIGFLGIGMTPNWSRADMPMMPKGRYRIMTAYMPKVGKLGLDMMYRTCTVQTNLDFSSEADMVKKLRVSLALQPVATAMFANSPFTEGKPNGLSVVSLRDLARHRCRSLRHAALGVRARHGLRALGRLRARRADVFHQARRPLCRRRRPVVPRPDGRQASRHAGRARHHLGLGQSHLDDLSGGAAQALSRDARLRQRTLAAGCRRCRPIGSGLLYDDDALDGGLGPGQELERARSARSCATTCPGSASRPRSGAAASCSSPRRRSPWPSRGCARRARLDGNGHDETRYLRPLQEFVARGITPAEELLEKYHGPWGGSVDPIFSEYAY